MLQYPCFAKWEGRRLAEEEGKRRERQRVQREGVRVRQIKSSSGRGAANRATTAAIIHQ